MHVVLLVVRSKPVLVLEYYFEVVVFFQFLVLYLSEIKSSFCLNYIQVLTWEDLTTPVSRWQCYFKILQTVPSQLKKWDKQGFLMPARLFMWIVRERGFYYVHCPRESILWCEGIALMEVGRSRQPDESICVFCLCKGKYKTRSWDTPLRINVISLNCCSYTKESGRSSRSFNQVCRKKTNPEKKRANINR